MSQPEPIELFEAIYKNSPNDVKAYFDAGGLVNIISDGGRTPLAEAALMLVDITKAAREEGQSDEVVSEAQKPLSEIGCLLLEQGSSFSARAGRTKVSITISQLMASRFPEIYKDWKAVEEQRILLGKVETQIQQAVRAKPRKM